MENAVIGIYDEWEIRLEQQVEIRIKAILNVMKKSFNFNAKSNREVLELSFCQRTVMLV